MGAALASSCRRAALGALGVVRRALMPQLTTMLSDSGKRLWRAGYRPWWSPPSLESITGAGGGGAGD